jgi:hypothetical protein
MVALRLLLLLLLLLLSQLLLLWLIGHCAEGCCHIFNMQFQVFQLGAGS